MTTKKILIAIGIFFSVHSFAQTSLSDIDKVNDAQTRSISPENFNGAKGGGAKAVTGTGAYPGRELGRGWKISPSVNIKAGTTFTIAEVNGPGTINHIWMTPTGTWRYEILRMYWDNETTPSVEVPVGDFFCQGWGEYAPLVSLPICVNPGSAFNCYWPMPFHHHCRITLENMDKKDMVLYYQVDYQLNKVPDEAAYFHAQFRRVNPQPFKKEYVLVDSIQGKGQYVGTYIALGVHNNSWWGEGEIKFYMDGDKDFPTICGTGNAQAPRWTPKQSQVWYGQQGWLVGANFISSDAVNQLEMWQAVSFDPPVIDRELSYAESIGMNCMRVFLHHAAWEQDPKGFKDRMRIYLTIAAKHHIKTIFVFFDDCWNDSYRVGKQPLPKPGIHNSGWLQDPGKAYGETPKLSDTLEAYVKDILSTFKKNKRILLWDLYNEPGNNDHFEQSLELLKKVFTWARIINPNQPLTAGYWNSDKQLGKINAFIMANDDVITYHNYEDAEHHQSMIDSLKTFDRPLICTEYMARKHGSTFFAILPMLKTQNIDAINWGLVTGKTNTKYAWDEPMPDGAEPKLWFHDIFHKDGTPFDPKETDFIKTLTKP